MPPNTAARNWISIATRMRGIAPLLVLIGLVALIGMLKPGFLTLDTLVVVMADIRYAVHYRRRRDLRYHARRHRLVDSIRRLAQ